MSSPHGQDQAGQTGAESRSSESTQPNAFSSARPARITIEGFEILRELSHGGQGIVYEAVQQSTKRKVAVKVLLEGMYASKSARRRFEREVELVANLKHPNIVVVFDSGTTADGRLYYVMDYVRGVSITQFVRDKKLTMQQALKLMAEVCDAVNHAHQKGVIHRDLKPSNILVDGEGRPRVLDFGLAKTVTDSAVSLASVTGEIVGTLQYMSPEQTRGNPELVDTRTDIYSLGMVLYEVLTGQFPYLTAGSMLEVIQQITQADPTPPSKRWTKEFGISEGAKSTTTRRCPIDGEVETIVLKALAKERERRYQAAGELGRDIRHYLAGEPIEAKRDSTIYILGKTLRRYRFAAAAAVLLVAILAVSAVVFAIERNRAIRAEQIVTERFHNEQIERQRADKGERQAKEQWATSLLLAGDNFFKSNRFWEARENYSESWQQARQLGLKELPAISGLLDTYASGPPPLMGNDGNRENVGGFAAGKLSVSDLAFAPDGLSAASCGGNRVYLWDVRTGKQLRIFNGHSESVLGVRFSTDGQTLISAGNDMTIRRWNLMSGGEDEPRRIAALQNRGAFAAAISPAHNLVLIADRTRTLHCWQLDSRKLLWQLNAGDVRTLAVSGDGRKIVVGLADYQSYQPNCFVFDSANPPTKMEDGKPNLDLSAATRLQADGPSVFCVAFSPDGEQVAAGAGNNILLFDLASSRLTHRFSGHVGSVMGIAFSPDGKLVASASNDRMIRIWSQEQNREIRSFQAHGGPVHKIIFAADGKSILSGGTGGALALWDLSRSAEVPTFSAPSAIHCMALSRDKLLALSGGIGRDNFWLWDTATGKKLRRLTGHERDVRAVAFLPGHQQALSAAEDSTLKLWDVLSGQVLRTLDKRTNSLRHIFVAANGQAAISVSHNDNRLQLWDLATNQNRISFNGHVPLNVGLSADGKVAVAVNEDGTISRYDANSGNEEPPLRAHPNRALALAVAADGGLVVSGDSQGQLIISDLATRTIKHRLYGHAALLQCIDLAPGGQIAASGGYDNAVRLWDVQSGQEIRNFAAHTQLVTGVAFSGDGQCLLSASQDGTMRFWDLTRPARYRDFETRVRAARSALDANEHDATALGAFGEYYAFRGRYDWAADFFEQARKNGATVSPLALARCYWQIGKKTEANREFEKALALHEAPEDYLRLCIDAN